MKIKSQIIVACLLALPLLISQCKKLTEEVDCEFPATVTLNNITNSSADASWSASAEAQQYLFEYRKVGTTGFTVVRVTSGTSTKLMNLPSQSTFEYRIQTNCPGSNSSYTALKQFTTLSNNEFNIVKKWRMKFYKENNVEVALGANDYMDFKAGGILSQSLTLGGSPVITDGTWTLFSNNDSVTIALSSTKKWKVETLSSGTFLLVKQAAAPLTTTDSLKLEAF